MTSEYIKPNSEIVKINLTGSVLEDTVGVDNRSEYGKWEDDTDAKRYRGFENDEGEIQEGTANTYKSIWDD